MGVGEGMGVDKGVAVPGVIEAAVCVGRDVGVDVATLVGVRAVVGVRVGSPATEVSFSPAQAVATNISAVTNSRAANNRVVMFVASSLRRGWQRADSSINETTYVMLAWDQ